MAERRPADAGAPRVSDRAAETTPTVAALYVDAAGVYANLPGVEVWDEARDARLYAGPWPVVAHPPCKRWSRMGLCRGYYDGKDEGCFEAALSVVREFKGVLEHPAYTLAWKRFNLPKPPAFGWTRSLHDDGFVAWVDQWHYGFPARKPTWLYYVGDAEPPEIWWGSATFAPSAADYGYGDRRTGESAPKRSATPPAFRDVLLAMARSAGRVPA